MTQWLPKAENEAKLQQILQNQKDAQEYRELKTKSECASCGDNENLIFCISCKCWYCGECNAWTSTHRDSSGSGSFDCKTIDGRHHKLGSQITISELEEKNTKLQSQHKKLVDAIQREIKDRKEFCRHESASALMSCPDCLVRTVLQNLLKESKE